MKLEELQWSEPTLKNLNQLISERMHNLGLQIKAGQPPLEVVIGEMCVVEAKLDALLHLLQSKVGLTFEDFDTHMAKVCVDGITQAQQIRAILTKPKGPTIVKG